MEVTVTFYSHLRDATGCATTTQAVADKSTLGELLEALQRRYSGLAKFRQSLLTAVGVEYQRDDYVLRPGDEVALFPPVQGG